GDFAGGGVEDDHVAAASYRETNPVAGGPVGEHIDRSATHGPRTGCLARLDLVGREILDEAARRREAAVVRHPRGDRDLEGLVEYRRRLDAPLALRPLAVTSVLQPLEHLARHAIAVGLERRGGAELVEGIR